MTGIHNNHRTDRERQSEAALSRSRGESLEGLLCDLRDQELRRIKAYARNESAEGQSIGDELDRARQHEEIEFKVSLLELSERLLAAITSALARMRESKFEVCEECEQPISPARLQSVPMAKYCLDCQREIEVAEERHKIRARITQARSSSLFDTYAAQSETVKERGIKRFHIPRAKGAPPI